MSTKRKHAKPVIARRARRDKTASEISLLSGDLLDDLPDDLLEAARVMEDKMKAAYTMPPDDARKFVLKAYRSVWARLMNQAAHGQGTGPKGPRGLSFVILLPHLAEAARILASKEKPFEQWVKEYPWPAGMKAPPSKTVRTWLARYGDLLYIYEPTNAKGERGMGF